MMLIDASDPAFGQITRRAFLAVLERGGDHQGLLVMLLVRGEALVAVARGVVLRGDPGPGVFRRRWPGLPRQVERGVCVVKRWLLIVVQ